MRMLNMIHATNREEWRAWLEQNYQSQNQVWLIFYKNGSRRNVQYNDAVEEALCFGWIDSNIQKIDEEKYARKFTPRGPASRWSELNKRRVAKMIQAGKMTQAGLAKITYKITDRHNKTYKPQPKKKVPVPGFLKRALMANKKAWLNFVNLAPSYRRIYVLWVSDAKRIETRNQRLREATQLLAKNQKLGMR